jgi:hypothetical protein
VANVVTLCGGIQFYPFSYFPRPFVLTTNLNTYFTPVCPSGQVAVGPCINRMCPAGYTCYGTGPNAQCCGTENTNSINFTPADAIGPCINGGCEADAECDTTQNLCFPILGAQIGPCIGDACPPGKF